MKNDEAKVEDYCEYQQRVIATLAPSLDLQLFSIPGFASLFGQSYHGLLLKTNALCDEKRSLEALSMLIQALKTERFWINHTSKWWKLMIRAVLISSDWLPYSKEQYREPLHRLANLSQYAPQPWQGREVAYCFATLSLWSYQQGRTQKAIEKIRAAIHADPRWGYAEYLLGWYGLLLEGIDPVPHFVRAIKLEATLWPCFKEDPLLIHFPEIREAVESLLQAPENKVQ